MGDLTLSDYSGLGSVSLYRGSRTKVSCILVNTPRGEQLLDYLQSLELHERPLDEPIKHERVFNRPFRKKPEVDMFKTSYAKEQDFDNSIAPIVTRLLNLEKRRARDPRLVLRRVLDWICPYRVKFFIKSLVSR